jgi:hypothetical protein
MHWMQRIHRPTVKSNVLIKLTDFAAAISRTENGAFLSFTIVHFPFDYLPPGGGGVGIIPLCCPLI